MKNKIYLASILILLVVFNSFAGNKKYFYYGPEGKVYLDFSTEKILVQFAGNTGFDDRASILSRENELEPLAPASILPAPQVAFVHLKTGSTQESAEALIARLNKTAGIISANPFFVYSDGTQQGLQDKFLVRLKLPSQYDRLQRTAELYKVTIDGQDNFDKNLYHLSITKSSAGNAMDVANLFFETGLFDYAEPDFLRILSEETPNDPFLNSQWELNNDGTNTSDWGGIPGCDLNVFNAWTITTGSPSIKIALIDDGVELTHPDLSGNLLPGYDATGLGSNGGPNATDGHGTSCAGIAAAVGNNNEGIAGIAYGCKIVPIRFEYKDNTGQLISTDSWTSNALNYAWQTAGVDVLSNSWAGGSPSSTITAAINSATTSGRNGKGAAVVFASGNNNGPVKYPAYLSNVIAVAAMSMCNERKNPASCDGENYWGSNFGTNLDVAAPGVKIYTTDRSGAAGYSADDYTAFFDGTSSACPAVAAVMALIYSVNPNLSLTDARHDLESTCQKVGSYTYNSNVAGQPNGTWSTDLGYGRVDAFAAVQAAGASGCAESFEPNNTKGSAAAISLNTNIISEISSATDVDWYKFSNTSSQSNIKLTLTGLPANYNIQLFNANGTKVAMSKNGGTSNEQIIYNTSSVGTYKVKVYGASGAFSNTQCYTLFATISNVPFRLNDADVMQSSLVSAFPNPASDQLNVAYNSLKDGTITIHVFDMMGRVMLLQSNDAFTGMNTYHLDLNSFTSGLYFLEIKNGNETSHVKFMIQK